VTVTPAPLFTAPVTVAEFGRLQDDGNPLCPEHTDLYRPPSYWVREWVEPEDER
jgi:hypothetical protein